MNMQSKVNWYVFAAFLVMPLHGMQSSSVGEQQDDKQQVQAMVLPAWFHPAAPMARNGSGTEAPFSSPVIPPAAVAPLLSPYSDAQRYEQARTAVTDYFGAPESVASIEQSGQTYMSLGGEPSTESISHAALAVLQQISLYNDYHAWILEQLELEHVTQDSVSMIEIYMDTDDKGKAALIDSLEELVFPHYMAVDEHKNAADNANAMDCSVFMSTGSVIEASRDTTYRTPNGLVFVRPSSASAAAPATAAATSVALASAVAASVAVEEDFKPAQAAVVDQPLAIQQLADEALIYHNAYLAALQVAQREGKRAVVVKKPSYIRALTFPNKKS